MRNALVIGLSKTGTTIVASVIQKSIPDARFLPEPREVGHLERLRRFAIPWVVKILYEHWMDRPFFLNGIVRGETGFSPDRTVAIVRDPRDTAISALMYLAYECVLNGASPHQVDEWLDVVRQKEVDPARHSVIELIGHLDRVFNVSFTVDLFFETFLNYTKWIDDNLARLHVLKYEDFVAGHTAELSASLGIALSEDREVDPSLNRVRRTRGSGSWQALMLPEDVTHLRPRYGAALARHGYDGWDLAPEKLNSADGSDYVARITREAFMKRAAKAQ